MVLYSEVSNKPAHISVFTLALKTMAFGGVRIDIALSEQEYQRCLASQGACDLSVSPLVPGLERDVVVVSVLGRVRVFSLSGTGQELSSTGVWQNRLPQAPSVTIGGHGDVLVSFSGRTPRLSFLHLRDPGGR